MWLTIYHRPEEISYDHGYEFIGHEFVRYLIEEYYRIAANPRILVNQTSNAIMESIQHVLGNLVRSYNLKETYGDKEDTGLGL